jgi:hypothetical protein
LHLQAFFVLGPQIPTDAQSLVALLVLALELVVRRRPWPAEHDPYVPPDAALGVRPEALLLSELVRVHVLSCGLATTHEEEVIAHEGGGIGEGDEREDEEGKRPAEVIDSVAKGDGLTMLVHEDLYKTSCHSIEAQQRPGGDEGKEKSVVALADAVVDPYTVVVVALYTVVTQSAMVPTRRSPDVACPTVLHWHFHSCGFGFS